MATNKAWAKTGLTGGTSTDLDGISLASLTNDDIAFVKVSNISYEYIFDSSSTSSESSPDIITPDDYGGSPGRWIIQRVYGIENENLLINPNFGIQQEGYPFSGSVAGGYYFFDGWFNPGPAASTLAYSGGYLDIDNGIAQLYGLRRYVQSQQVLGPIEGNPLTVSGDINGTVTISTGYAASSAGALTVSSIGTLTGSDQSLTFNANYNSVTTNYLVLQVTGTGTVKWLKVEEGPVKTQFVSPLFFDELEKCKYYFIQSYNYGIQAGTVTNVGSVSFKNNTGGAYTVFDALPCKVNEMAKTPTVILYSSGDGTGGTVYDIDGATNRVVSSVNDLGSNGFSSITIASTPDTNRCRFHYSMDARP